LRRAAEPAAGQREQRMANKMAEAHSAVARQVAISLSSEDHLSSL